MKIAKRWQDVIKSPEQYNDVNKSDLSKIVSKLSSVANKRLRRMDEKGIKYSGYSGSDEISGVKKFGALGKSLGQLRAEYKRLVGFLESPISSLTGRKEQYYETVKRLWERGDKTLKSQLGKKPTRREAYKEYEKSYEQPKQTASEKTNEFDIPTQADIFNEVSRLFQIMREEQWLSKSEMLYQIRVSSQIREYFEEQVYRARLYNMDVIEWVRKDLGVDNIYEESPNRGTSTSQFF